MSNATAVTAFERELNAELGTLFRETVPRGVAELVLDLRQQIEDNAPVGTKAFEPSPRARPSSRRRPGTLKASVGVSKTLVKAGRIQPGHAAAQAVLDGWKIGDPLLVVVDTYYASFVEGGTEKMPARPFVRPALELFAEREVKP
jgi:HK97 gp10 family phage protein